jgi:primosomal protein N' (replication factor Y)
MRKKFYDTIKTNKQLAIALEKIVNNKVKLIVGTQMLAKGHHFPHLKLVAIIDIDGALYSADFRAPERLGQLITQVAGRAGRVATAGKVLLQSSNPQHIILQTIIQQPYERFLELCLHERQEYLLPPASYQILIISHSKKLSLSENFLLSLQEYIRHSQYREHVLCMGPMPGMIEKKNNIYALHLTLQSNSRKVLHMLLDELLSQEHLFAYLKNLKWIIDVDPLQLA